MKNKRNRLIPIILLLVIIGVALTACGSTTSPLVGKWQPTEDEGYIEFFSDGKFEMGDEYQTFTGTYEETGDKEVTLTLESYNGEPTVEDESVILEYSFSGDELTLDDGESPVTFIRVD